MTDRKTIERIVEDVLRASARVASRTFRKRERQRRRELDVDQEKPEVVELSPAKLTFSDGTNLHVQHGDVVIFVGPNNAGKSRALVEIQALLTKEDATGHVVSTLEKRKRGSTKDFERFLEVHAAKRFKGSTMRYEGYLFDVDLHWVDNVWSRYLSGLAEIFTLRIATEDRIRGSNPADAINFLEDAPKHPIHRLYTDDRLELLVGSAFERAFGQKLTLFRAGGAKLPLIVGTPPDLAHGESVFSQSHVARVLNDTVPLHKQGDGMRSFVTVLIELVSAVTQKVVLIDEPEAFLHPPQARALGELCMEHRAKDSIVFVATHSPDALEGMLSSNQSARIVRIRRDGKVNRTRELSSDIALEITRDPLMRYFGVLQGLFHDRVVVCEADADCMFYSAMLRVLVDGTPDVLFLHSNGKQRMAKVLRALRALDVKTSAVVDIDVLNDEKNFRDLFEALGGEWAEVKDTWRSIYGAVTERSDWPKTADVIQSIEAVTHTLDRDAEFSGRARADIVKILKASTPWGRVKAAGRSGLPAGQATQKFDQLVEACAGIGLWIVPVGELEGFCRSIDAAHGPRWAQKVIDDFDLANAEELEEARRFVRQVWAN